ncbi:hypothetical protein M501DRAFT_933925 [Patellaria atrata CBS 101060]|uniref:Vacuolar ATPase assembly protein VMA22 n=1 Tax=Patellaria atrata CBS 101060 TaxID=1346257 RepID=A0A9P4VR40_9PEZI|nr:hypothetical protein M501DRAFT_933925 [Patellaria atrata CBS 101060]
MTTSESPAVPDHDALIQKLDAQLTKYLHLLDSYQSARATLSRQLSQGFLSLAQANFSNGGRTRYGQDYYDERMKAIRRVNVKEENGTISYSISIASDGLSASQVKTEEEEDAESSSYASKENNEDSPASDEKAEASEGFQKGPTNPLHWFGILVPPPLRSAQKSFETAVEQPLPALVKLTKDMRELEIEISRLRKAIKKSIRHNSNVQGQSDKARFSTSIVAQ